MLPHLQRQVDQNAINAGTHLKRVQLFLLQLSERAHLVHFGLLFGHLRFDRLLVDIQPFIFNVVSRGEFVGLALRRLVCQA